MSRTVRAAAPALLAFLTAFLMLAAGATPARAADGVVETFKVSGTVDNEGILRAEQVIAFDKAPGTLEQRLSTRGRIDSNRDYVYEISDIKVRVGDQDVEADVSDDGHDKLVRVDTSNLGDKSVTISYTVKGTTRSEDGGTIFQWPVLQGLNAEVKKVEGGLLVSSVPQMIDCTAGAPGTLDKCQYFMAGAGEQPQPAFSTGPVGAGGEVVLTLGLTGDTVAATAQVEERWTLDRAFSLNPATILTALGALLLGSALLYLLFRRTGLDVAHSGELTPAGTFKPVGDGESVFEVDESLRPGLLGTVADERVDPVDVTGSLLDLAVRGHLRITELPRAQHGLLDWEFSRTSPGGSDLRPFEQRLLDAVAPEGATTLVSQLPATLAPVIAQVQDDMYDEVVEKGWFETRPDSVRSKWRTYGLVGLGVAGLAAVLLVMFTTHGLLALVLLLLASGLLWIADRMPRRTNSGSHMLSSLVALSSLLQTHPTSDMPKGREIAEISKVLPYAVVLGGKNRWVAAMVEADDDAAPDPTDIDWYHAPETWHLRDLPTSLTQFITTVQGELFGR